MEIEQGFELINNVLGQHHIKGIIRELERTNNLYPIHGIRNAEKKLTSIRALVSAPIITDIAAKFLSGPPQLVRAIMFNKTAEKNWHVNWHQDKTIAVNRKLDIPDWGPWTLKDGVHHVQPSIDVLEKMITLRIHLDETDEHNGCLKLIPNSHSWGILDKAQLKTIKQGSVYHCIAKAGDVLAMKPHILHASEKATRPSHRRILHVEYSDFKLPDGLEWA